MQFFMFCVIRNIDWKETLHVVYDFVLCEYMHVCILSLIKFFCQIVNLKFNLTLHACAMMDHGQICSRHY